LPNWSFIPSLKSYSIINYQFFKIWHVEVVAPLVDHQVVVKVKEAVQAEAATE